MAREDANGAATTRIKHVLNNANGATTRIKQCEWGNDTY